MAPGGAGAASEDGFIPEVETEPYQRPVSGPCQKCGAAGDLIDRDGYCGVCGYRQARPTDHIEADVDGAVAVSDKGLRHHRNEDAYALRVGPGHRVLVVCDGVSTTANPDLASAAAAAAVADEVVAELAGGAAVTGEDGVGMLARALASGQEAVLAVPPQEPGGYAQAPSTTAVAVLLTPDVVASASVGDSRSYWVATSADGWECHQLSRDDSCAEEAIALGASPEDAYAARNAHTITRWLGPDAPELAPNTATAAPAGAGLVLVCSDGLWNYYPTPETMRDLIAAGPEGESPLAMARRLTDAAIAAGGHDNITVAIAPVAAPARAQAEAPTETPEPGPGPAPDAAPLTEE